MKDKSSYGKPNRRNSQASSSDEKHCQPDVTPTPPHFHQGPNPTRNKRAQPTDVIYLYQPPRIENKVQWIWRGRTYCYVHICIQLYVCASVSQSLGVCTYALQKTGRWVGRDRYIDRDEIETELELPPKTFCLQHPFWSFI